MSDKPNVETFGSLFAGIGGLDLGLERAGMTCVWQVEKDEYCRQILAKHWPDVPRFDDVRTFGAAAEPVNLICGGFPCQPFSFAGQRAGQKDDRYLWPEMVRVIAEVRPAWVLGENVPGLIGLGLDEVLADLENLGYTVWPVCIPACAVDAPHIRERVWILAHTERECSETKRGQRQTTTGEGTGGRAHRKRSGSNAQRQESLGGAGQDSGVPSNTNTNSKSVSTVDAQASGMPSDILGAGNEWPSEPRWWQPEPDVDRVVNGVPRRMDRLRALGNAVVPQVAEAIGRKILAASNSEEGC